MDGYDREGNEVESEVEEEDYADEDAYGDEEEEDDYGDEINPGL